MPLLPPDFKKSNRLIAAAITMLLIGVAIGVAVRLGDRANCLSIVL
jgi:hypothetical protein